MKGGKAPVISHLNTGWRKAHQIYLRVGLVVEAIYCHKIRYSKIVSGAQLCTTTWNSMEAWRHGGTS